MDTWGIARRLFAIDVLTMAFVAALAAGTIAHPAQVPEWLTVVIVCAVVAGGVPLLGLLRAHLDLGVVRVLHDWWFPLSVYALYLVVLLVAGPSHGGRVFDGWLIAADRWMFGADPTVWLFRFGHPVATELLQLSYSLFALLPLLVAAELYLGGRDRRFRQWLFVCGCGFFASFAGYLILPAVGPRITLHELGATPGELPGLWLTPWLRAIVDGGGGIVPAAAVNGVTLRMAPRDAFPAVHALVTIMTVVWAWRFRLGVRWIVTVIGTPLLFAAVYLRYHYVVDVLAGAVLAALCLTLAPAAHGWLARHLGTMDEVIQSR